MKAWFKERIEVFWWVYGGVCLAGYRWPTCTWVALYSVFLNKPIPKDW